MHDIIQRHREERDHLLSGVYIPRDGLDQARRFLSTDLIKVISGPRRAGKSVFALSMLRGKNFAYVNFDDEALMGALRLGNYDRLIEVFGDIYPGYTHILLDEVQNLDHWEQFLNKLQRRGHNLIVTGSNAKLLRGEWATSLTGRTYEIDVFPFSYAEYRRARPAGSVREYLRLGGYPEIVVKHIDKQSYIDSLVHSILIKDIAMRHNVNRPQILSAVNKYLLTQFGHEITYTSLARIFRPLSVNTMLKYVTYLTEPYLYFLLDRYHVKPKLRIISPKKLYLYDTALASMGFSADVGSLLENACCLQLIRRGLQPNAELFSYKTVNGKEVDFVWKNGMTVEQVIQVCADITNPKTLRREVSALYTAGRELRAKETVLITLDPSSVSARDLGITHLWDAEMWFDLTAAKPPPRRVGHDD
ncbi:MAG: ATP-binding protein [Patescibacteria group bacterium]